MSRGERVGGASMASRFTAALAANLSCRAACPVGTHAGGYVALLAQGRVEEAYALARARNPFASVCGRVCAHPCEAACRRANLDGAVGIRALKRFATERHGVESGRSFDEILEVVERPRPRIETEGRRVAIVGAGPAGLSCAHDLALMGHHVVLFDASTATGGMMRQGIPAYRLPRDLLDREIEFVRWLGVDFRLGVEIGKDVPLADLIEQFDAVFVAPGCRRGRRLPIPGGDARGVVTALEFLAQVNLSGKADVGRRVLVIGGGNVAFDAARTARRLPPGGSGLSQLSLDSVGTAARVLQCDVTLAAVETADELVADVEELVEAGAENIDVHLGLMPTGIEAPDGHVTAVHLQRVVRALDDSGRFAPQLEEGPPVTIECDSVVLAVGQTIDLAFLGPEIGRSEAGFVAVDPETLATNLPGVYAGGDAAFGPRNLVDAVADGQRAARAIDTHLTGRVDEIRPYRLRVLPTAGYDHPFAIGDYDAIPHGTPPTLAPERRSLGAEVERGWAEHEARREARRCLHCWVNTVFDCSELDGTVCIRCRGCVDVCPRECIDLAPLTRVALEDGASPLRLPDGREFGVRAGPFGSALIKDETACIRCGLCARRCPVGAITMQALDREQETSLVRLADRSM